MAPKYTLPALALALVAGLSIAQQTQTQTSGSTSGSAQGGGSASSSASGSAHAGGSQSGSQSASGNATGSGSGGKFKITHPNYAVFFTPNPVGAGNSASTVSPSLFDDEKKYYDMLGQQGNLLYAGPWRDSNGGMMILSCKNDQEAQLIADQDPLVKANLYVANIRAWNVTYIGPYVVQPDKSQTATGGGKK